MLLVPVLRDSQGIVALLFKRFHSFKLKAMTYVIVYVSDILQIFKIGA